MKFDDLDRKMRVFETSHDHCVLPGLYMVARLDGRSFTRLTKEVHQFEAPFDVRFRDFMVETTEHLMGACGFNATYGYTESDEISLLFDLNEVGFQRKLRKLNSVLAGEASAKFSLLLGSIGCFDCRISQLPTAELVVDYFRWRNEDAHRNALNAHCYWSMRKRGQSVGGTRRPLRRRQKRTAFSAGYQLQRAPPLAEARLRHLLEVARPSRQESDDRRRCRRSAPAAVSRFDVAHETCLLGIPD